MAFCAPVNLSLHRHEYLPLACKSASILSRRKGCAVSHRKVMRATRPTDTGAAAKTEQLIRKFWELTSTGKYSTVTSCFTDDAIYHDGLFPKPCVGKEAILAHFRKFETVLPSSFRFVLDDIVAGPDRAGARWHVETGQGTELPLSRGLSIYHTVECNGEFFISQAWEYGETPFKVPIVILPLLRLSGWLLRFRDSAKRNTDK